VQATRTLDRAAGGLGVGLTLVRSLVEMHGGRVTARSDGEGKGAEFVVLLPLAGLPANLVVPLAPQMLLPAPAPQGARIVVVEDNADSREALCAFLERAGLECDTAATGGAAVDLIDQVSPDVVILDLGLPELDGFEVARRVRANPKHSNVRLIALTGYGQEADRASTLQAGFNEHLVKPVHGERLLRALANTQAPAVLDPDARPDSGSQAPGPDRTELPS
jgi:two-component system, chemotaxis family, CheB/CheR fusion protein